MNLRLGSLEGRLAARLSFVILTAAALIVALILLQGYQAADRLSNEQLLARANELARLVTSDSAGRVRLELPPNLERLYRPPAGPDLFLVQDDKGRVVAASSPEFASAGRGLSIPTDTPKYFRLEQFGPNEEDYYGLRLHLNSTAGRLLVTVARASDADALAYALLLAFVREIAWVIPVFAAATLGIAIWCVRRSLRPILSVSAQAAGISPAAIAMRLSSDDLPSEIEPLVKAVNRALDRLEEGFAIQRQFTANAAHELRTPLAILTAGLENLDGPDSLQKLRTDAARMNRLVDQLLRVARLDAVPLEVSKTIDLGATAAGVVEYLAPWAVAQGRQLGFEAPKQSVLVRGNVDAIADAVRNMIENAVSHTPAGTEVAVAVAPDGGVSVCDRGPGVPLTDRAHVFDRFWRGRNEGSPGAGLGLAIVAEVARAHDAIVDIAEAPGGGAMFTMRFHRVTQTARDAGFAARQP